MYDTSQQSAPGDRERLAVVTVTADRPTAVTDTETKPGTVSLTDGETAFVTAIRRDFAGNEARQATAAGAAAVPLVATLSELADTAGRDKGRLTSNHEHEYLDSAGLSLRVPPISTTANDQGVYGFYGYQQAMLRTIADAKSEHEIQLPEEERAQRALSYVGAELVADRRLEEENESDDQASEETGENGVDVDDERLTELLTAVGFDPEDDPEAAVEWINETLENDRVSYIAARTGADPATERENLLEARYKLNRRIHWLGLQVDDKRGTVEASDPVVPEPTDGVLGYDWVRTGDHRWTGRSLRGLLYAVMTESSGLNLPADTVDRVELINYGEPSVRAYEVPSERRDLTLVSGDEPPGDPDRIDRHAVDFRVLGDFSDVKALTEERIENAVRQHLNTLQLLTRYDESIEREPRDITESDEELAAAGTSESLENRSEHPTKADGAGPAGMTDEATDRKQQATLKTPFDDLVPAGLREAMDKVHNGWRNGEYNFEAYLTDTEIVGTSHSWETDR